VPIYCSLSVNRDKADSSHKASVSRPRPELGLCIETSAIQLKGTYVHADYFRYASTVYFTITYCSMYLIDDEITFILYFRDRG